MFGKLRRRFILISMLSVILVLGIIIGGINIISYNNTVRNADNILELLSHNQGQFPDEPAPQEQQSMTPPGQQPPDQQPPEPRRMDEMQRSPELAFESRYFSVLLDGEGNVLETDTGKIAAIGEDEASTYAQRIYSEGKIKGFISDYRFLNISEGEDTRIIFYDCGRSLDSFRAFLKASLLISSVGIVVVFVLIFFASGRIVRPVAESYEKQKRFITDAGHEIKTPLAIINADADVILMDGENSWAQDIKEQTGRLTELTNKLIKLSRLEEAQEASRMERVDISKLTKDACDSFASRFLTENRTLSKDIGEGLYVTGDPQSLKELLSILLDNALKYSPEGGQTRVRLYSSTKTVSLEVTNDTDNVIDKESARRLFDRFYRTDKSRNSQTGGYGIGLSMAKAIVEAHKGKITANSAGNGKLTIKAQLPLNEG
ncbi:MAG: HAMP domain-containing histidine kinase [Clostridiales bacterium]|nr:HAMP domain-containing histidine kinase [Clostridiales bacterium]